MSHGPGLTIEGSERVLLFGGLPWQYLKESEITSDLELVRDRLGVSVERVPHEELVQRCEALSDSDEAEADGLAHDLMGHSLAPQASTIDQAKVRKATRLYMAMRAILIERRVDAVTIAGGPFYSDKSLPLPCVPLMLLQEDGVPAACQGDIDALLTMILLKRASGWSSFMGGAYEADGCLRITHCALSRRTGGWAAPLLPYRVADYHGERDSPTVHTEVSVGQAVTIARLTRNLEGLILARGVVLENADLPRHCRNTLVVQVPDLPALMTAIKGIQYHLVIAWGDYTAQLAALAHRAGMRILPEARG